MINLECVLVVHDGSVQDYILLLKFLLHQQFKLMRFFAFINQYTGLRGT